MTYNRRSIHQSSTSSINRYTLKDMEGVEQVSDSHGRGRLRWVIRRFLFRKIQDGELFQRASMLKEL